MGIMDIFGPDKWPNQPAQNNQGGAKVANNQQQFNPYDYFSALNMYQQAQAPSFQNGLVGMGMNAMNNLGANTSNAFGAAAALSSQNTQAKMAAESPIWQEYYRQQGQNQRLETLAPLLGALFGGGMGGSGGVNSASTNYGAGYNFGNQQAAAPVAKPNPNSSGYFQKVKAMGGTITGKNPNALRLNPTGQYFTDASAARAYTGSRANSYTTPSGVRFGN